MDEIAILKERIAFLQQEKAGTFEVRFDATLDWMRNILIKYGVYKHGPPIEEQFKKLFSKIIEDKDKVEEQ